MDVLERLHQNQVYPIVLLIKFKSVKQIKEIKENESLTKDTVIEELKAKYEKSLEKKRGAKKKLKEELYDKEEEIESA